MKKLIYLSVIFLFALDVSFAQSDYPSILRQRNEEYTNILNQRSEDYSNILQYELWSAQKREEYARWKEQSASVATNENVPSGRQSPAVVPQMKVWVVIVGVGRYHQDDISDLDYTKDDAYRMYSFYQSIEGGSLPDEQITILLDRDATRENVVPALVDMYRKADENDAIVFYFSGHGLPGAFVLHECDGEVYEDYKGWLLHEELNYIFEQSPARYKYIIADACHSGYLAELSVQTETETKTKSIAQKSYYQAFETKKKGFVMMLSSMGKELSIEAGGFSQGLFSYFLIRGLKGDADSNEDGIVTVTELYDFVDAGVKYGSDGTQNPVLAGDYYAAMPIAVVRRKQNQ